MTDEIVEKAVKFAKKHKTAIAREITDTTVYPSDPNPVSVFMAGSPGAGKTETSKSLLAVRDTPDKPTIRIDPDELRERFEGYDGSNSWIFQYPIAILVDRIHDLVLKNRQNFLLDGTLTNLDIARKNIGRSLKKDRFVQILYVYQDPLLAWEFVKARERAEGRRIEQNTFVEQYFAARRVVNQLKQEFEKDIQVDLILKNRDNTTKVYKDSVANIDHHVPEKYTEGDLVEALEKYEKENGNF